jgi:peptidoglycan/xylan/chitin deacetylase (PgdA/CDA1 family)
MGIRLAKLPIKALCKLGAGPTLLRLTRGAPVILMYHGVTREIADGLVNYEGKHVHVDLFRRQMQMLTRSRIVVPLADLVQALLGDRDTSGLAAITFDDGYLNNLEYAAPVLAELRLHATFFLATGFIGTARWAWVDRIEAALHSAPRGTYAISVLGERVRLGGTTQRAEVLRRAKTVLKTMAWNTAEACVCEVERELGAPQSEPWGIYQFMKWDGARELAHAGFELGAHTVNHAILSRITEANAESEITSSREQVKSAIGACAATFCYPNGKRADYTGKIVDICRRYFTAALSAELGSAKREELYELRRVPVDARTSESLLASMIAQA